MILCGTWLCLYHVVFCGVRNLHPKNILPLWHEKQKKSFQGGRKNKFFSSGILNYGTYSSSLKNFPDLMK
jgi:hypothetical protein